MKIGVIGTGYVGLVTGACFADAGHTVLCADRDAGKIKKLREGIIPIYEPGLEEIVKRTTLSKRLSFTTSNEELTQSCDVIFFAVGTPSQKDGSADLSFFKAAVEEVASHLKRPTIFVTKSTVPVGTYKKVKEWVSTKTKVAVEVVSNPEFLKEGTAVGDFQKPDRVVIGAESDRAFEIMSEIYLPFVRQGNPILRMDPTSAEIAKYACNSFLASRISFMNELTHLCEKVGGDIDFVRQGMSTDVRIGKHFLYPGPGYGGSCFPKDVRALLHTAHEQNVSLRIIHAVEEANSAQKKVLFQKLVDHFKNEAGLKGRTIAVLGLAFKPLTDDIREAPALTLIEDLFRVGAQVQAFDPAAMENTQNHFGDRLKTCKSLYDAVEGADAAVIVTEWNEFRNPDFDRIKSLMKTPVLIDGRNIFSAKKMRELGFDYRSIGRQ